MLSIPVPYCGLTTTEFRHDGLSPAGYKSLQKQNLGPKETLIPGTQERRIMPADYEDWIKLIQAPDTQLTEALRRLKAARRRGLIAAKSPTHPSNLLRSLRAAE
jgi:hypothetical protein